MLWKETPKDGGKSGKGKTRTTTITTTTLMATTTKSDFKGPAIIVVNLVTRKWIVARRHQILKSLLLAFLCHPEEFYSGGCCSLFGLVIQLLQWI